MSASENLGESLVWVAIILAIAAIWVTDDYFKHVEKLAACRAQQVETPKQ